MNPLEGASTIEQAMMDKAREAKAPINGSIELTPLCNMSCEMCYVRMDRGDMEKQGRLRTAEEWLEIGQQMRDAGTLFLLLTGGEPLLYPEFKEVYLGLKRMGMIITVNTNGTLINEEWADFFAAHKPRRINLTLYGHDSGVYRSLCHYEQGFDRAVKAVKLLKERSIDVRINVSAAKANADSIDGILDICKELDVFAIVDPYMVPAVRERSTPYSMQARLDPVKAAGLRISAMKRVLSEKDFALRVARSLFEVENFAGVKQESGMSCYAANCSFAINWQGNMRPCVVSSEPSVSVFEEGFMPAWKQVCSFCEPLRINVKCLNCRLRPLCNTCPVTAKIETGTYEGISDYLCRYAEESYRLLKLEEERINND